MPGSCDEQKVSTPTSKIGCSSPLSSSEEASSTLVVVVSSSSEDSSAGAVASASASDSVARVLDSSVLPRSSAPSVVDVSLDGLTASGPEQARAGDNIHQRSTRRILPSAIPHERHEWPFRSLPEG